MRTLNVAAQALLARIQAGEQIPAVQLVELQFTEAVYLTTAGRTITWSGHDWVASQLGTIEPIEDASGDVQALQFSLPGVSAEQLAIALTAQVEGTVVRVYDALVDPATGAVADAVLAWAGTLNVPGIDDGGDTASVIVTAEHRGLAALRAKPSRYTDDEQRRLYPGDTSLDVDPVTDGAPIAWPAASFFKQQ